MAKYILWFILHLLSQVNIIKGSIERGYPSSESINGNKVKCL